MHQRYCPSTFFPLTNFSLNSQHPLLQHVQLQWTAKKVKCDKLTYNFQFLQDVNKCFVFHNHLLKRHLQILNYYSHGAPNHLKRSSSLKSHRRKCIVCTENLAKQPCFWCLQASELNIPLLFCQMNIVLNCSSVSCLHIHRLSQPLHFIGKGYFCSMLQLI